ncbi:putative leader peptide [Goekera deserti]|nr:putative leader peptide [Goekera deserti]
MTQPGPVGPPLTRRLHIDLVRVAHAACPATSSTLLR